MLLTKMNGFGHFWGGLIVVIIIVAVLEFAISNIISKLDNQVAIIIEPFDASGQPATRSQIEVFKCMASFQQTSQGLDTNRGAIKIQPPEN